MLTRTMNADLLNEVANHPDVRPFLGGAEGPLDLTNAAQNPDNYLLQGDRGCFLLHPVLPGVYELHTIFAPDGRGKPFFDASTAMFRFMFAETPALEIVTKCPDNNTGARWAAAKVGFRERFRREAAWEALVGISYRAFSMDDWFVRDPACLQEGEAFHHMLEEAKRAAGSELDVHPKDDAHDRAVGAAVLLAKAGQLEKGAAFYNRWAILAGYATITIAAPHVVDIQDALVEVRNGQMGVLLCRLEPQSPLPASPAPGSEP